MMVRLAIGPLTLALVSGFAVAEQAIANGGGPWDIEHDIATGIVTWKDQDGEAAYQVSGTISYKDLTCAPDPETIPGDILDFSEELPAETTSFQLPLPEHEGVSVKDVSFSIEALDANGEVIDLDGFGLTVDGFCFPEELPSTGAGFEGQSSDRLLPGFALLFAVGVGSLLGGLITRRKRA